WAQLIEAGKAAEKVQIVSLLKPYFCPETGGKFKRGHRFNVSDHGSLWLKESKSHKWHYEPAIKVDVESTIPTAYFLVEPNA
ncbi:hypothetical protein ACUBIP_26230, partial [Escherichia coli]